MYDLSSSSGSIVDSLVLKEGIGGKQRVCVGARRMGSSGRGKKVFCSSRGNE